MEPKNLREALLAAKTEFKPIFKDSNNPYFKSRYADLAGYLEAIGPALDKYKISLFQPITIRESGCGERYHVLSTILSFNSESLCSEMEIPKCETAQALGSYITYARRYTLSILGLAAEDDDGNAASAPAPTKKSTNSDLAELRKLLADKGFKDSQTQDAMCVTKYGRTVENLTSAMVSEIINKIKAKDEKTAQ